MNEDTVNLLRECDAGVKMGVDSINDVLDNVDNDEFERLLTDNKEKHQKYYISLQCFENVISLWLSRYSCKNLNGKGYVISSSHCPKPTVSIFFNS